MTAVLPGPLDVVQGACPLRRSYEGARIAVLGRYRVALVIRATISFKSDAGSQGWLTDLAELPRIGDEIVLRDHGGELLQRGRVADVRHLIFGDPREYRAGASQVEVDVDATS